MSANGISHLQFKRDRQDAKLALAATNRTASGRRATLNSTQLPTRYGIASNSPVGIIDIENAGGLVAGRPWSSVVGEAAFDPGFNAGFNL
jgi:hypothetical protein